MGSELILFRTVKLRIFHYLRLQGPHDLLKAKARHNESVLLLELFP